jgi:hypothetical protein
MTIDDVIEDFGGTGHTLPRASMQWALDNWALAAPRFLELLSRYVDGIDTSKSTADALFFIVHLLGEKAETGAFVDMCRLSRGKGARAVFGDAITTTLRQILISTFDGNIAALHSVVEDAGADEFVRDAAILAVAWLTRVGPIPEAETRAWLSQLPAAMQPQAECYVWVGWTECVAVLGLAEFAPDVRGLFERGLIPDYSMEYEHFEMGLKLTLDDPERMAGLTEKRLAPFTQAIDTLAGWYGFSESYARDMASRAEKQAEQTRQEQQRRDRDRWRHVGRNDPCPCGSGRKFKKCCLGKTSAEQLAAGSALGA